MFSDAATSLFETNYCVSESYISNTGLLRASVHIHAHAHAHGWITAPCTGFGGARETSTPPQLHGRAAADYGVNPNGTVSVHNRDRSGSVVGIETEIFGYAEVRRTSVHSLCVWRVRVGAHGLHVRAPLAGRSLRLSTHYDPPPFPRIR